MSKIAEQKALEEYPKETYYDRDVCDYVDINAEKRDGYIKDYDQAIQDFLEKAEMYLKTRVYYNMHPNNVTTAIQDFKNYMQDERKGNY